MCDHELLVAYLYEDLSAAERARFDSHLTGCAACRRELEALRGVRVDLASWAPPLPDFGFRIVHDAAAPPVPAPVLTSPRWTARWLPAMSLAAAALLVLALASALAHLDIRYGRDGLSVRTGWGAAPAAVPQNAASRPPVQAPASALDPAVVAQIELRLSALETASHDAGVRQASTVASRSDAELIRRFKELLAQSETRQRGELALRMSQVIHDVEAQRVADLGRIQQGFGRIDAMATSEAAAHRDLANYITSQRQK